MKVRHLVLTKKLSQREVSRRTGISRNTIAKYVKDPSPRVIVAYSRDERVITRTTRFFLANSMKRIAISLPKISAALSVCMKPLSVRGSPGLTIRYDDMPITNVLFRRLVTFPWSLMQATHCNLIGAMRRPSLGELNARFMWRTSACVTAVNLLWWPTCAKAKR